ncbi:MAG: hypothetical protein QM696_10465 [Steroidobacteraceae bacterium]
MKRIIAMAGMSVLFLGTGVAICAQTKGAAPKLLDMTGFWERDTLVRNDHYDPNTPTHLSQKPPLNAEYAAKWKTNIAMSEKGDLSYDTAASCYPKGMPRVLMAPYGLEIMATDKQVNLYNEGSAETVRIYLDGKQQEEGAEPTYIGFTNGSWDGKMLSAKTVNLRADKLFDSSGIPHSDALTVQQTIRFLDKDTLEDIVTASDPKAFTEDWVVRMVFRRQPESAYVHEYFCKLKTEAGVSK